ASCTPRGHAKSLRGERKGHMRVSRAGVLFVAIPITASASTGGALAKSPATPQYVVPQSMAQVSLTFAPIVKRVAPAVVNVYTRSVVQAPVNPFFSDPFFRQFFGGGGLSRERVQQ